MPPKKKRSSSKKGSKKVGKEKPKAALFESDLALPIIPLPQAQGILGAVACSDVRTVTRLIQHYNCTDYLKETDANGSTPLHIATRRNDISLTIKLLSFGNIDINKTEVRTMGGLTALHLACANGSEKLVEALIKEGADIHLKSDSALGERPLHSCCKNGSVGCARLLLAAGCQTDLRDNFGHNASYWAMQKGFGAMVTELELPLPKAATAAEFFALMQEKLKGKFVLPGLGKKKGDKKGGKSGKGKSKSPGKKKKK
jgi:hypothetical protein